MLIFILSYLGGVLTIFSPCVLPVIPFVFSRSDQPFLKNGLPMLIGMALSFAIFSALSVVGGRWVVQANQIGRGVAFGVFCILGLSLIFSQFAERLTQPLVRLGGALQKKVDVTGKGGFVTALLLGASVGLLWAPCAGPILGLVLAGATLSDSDRRTFGLLFVFALGAATSLSIAILASGRVLRILKRGLVAEVWIKRVLGVLVLGAVTAMATGFDTKILSKIAYLNTHEIEQKLVDRATGQVTENPLSDEGQAPSLGRSSGWLNSPPLTMESLRGKVVLIDFWTYSCINCLRTLPYLKAWGEKYRDQGLVVIGVHTPEFAFERDFENVKNAVQQLGISYPVVVDNEQSIWSSYKNTYWPAHYFIDVQGHIRYHHFGEGKYEESEQVIRDLLQERPKEKLREAALPMPIRVESASSQATQSRGAGPISPETYLGYQRQKGFSAIPDIKKNRIEQYRSPVSLGLNHWSISGVWMFSSEMASLQSHSGTLSFRFQARDLHLVMGAHPKKNGVPFRVSIDGRTLGPDQGKDTDSLGNGTVKGHRLYHLIRQKENSGEHTIRIEFLDSGVEVFAFTFG